MVSGNGHNGNGNGARPAGQREPRIVVIGGGTGISSVLRGLRDRPCKLTAIVTMFDSGGSSGLLRQEFGYPPFGDLRQCLVALADEEKVRESIKKLFGFRFRRESSLNGHNIGNLVLAALTTVQHDVESAIEEVGSLLHVKGQVIPVSLQTADLCAELEDGTVIRGESKVDLRNESTPRIKRVFLDPPAQANRRAIDAVLGADAVVLGPGDLYTSIVPNLLVGGVPQAIAACNAPRIYICNLMTKRGETDGFRASDFVSEIDHYLGGPRLDWVLGSRTAFGADVERAYQAERAEPVRIDSELLMQMGLSVAIRSLAHEGPPVRHDPDRTADAILRIIEAPESMLTSRRVRTLISPLDHAS